MSFSVYDKTKHFNLTSTEAVQYPIFKSKETFLGRKCFETQWVNGDRHFLAGFSTENVLVAMYAYPGKSSIIIRTEYGERKEISYKVGDIEAMKKYMLCIDTIKKNFLMINGTYTRTISYPSNVATRFSTFASQGYSGVSDFINCYYSSDFENQIPASFVSLIDRRQYAHPTCKANAHNHIFSRLSFLFLIIK